MHLSHFVILRFPLPLFASLRDQWFSFILLCVHRFHLITPNKLLGYAVVAFHLSLVFGLALFAWYIRHSILSSFFLRAFTVSLLSLVILHWYLLGGICSFTPIECLFIDGDLHKDTSIAGRFSALFGIHQNTSHLLVLFIILFAIWKLIS